LARPVEIADQADATPVAPPSEAVELAFWESVHASEDPQLFAAYLEKYPEGEFAVIARARQQALRSAK
jgi:hypothetical protein